jgi:quercetin dioxygenase-like cupin family protein
LPLPDFDAFRTAALARGFDEVVVRRWEPGVVLHTHTHPFAAEALVVQGEMWLDERHLQPGDTFRLEANVPHRERYGSDGATYWVARRS